METWLIWLAVAVVLVVAEIMTASFFLLWFGIGAAVASVIAYFSPENSALQLAVFVVVSGVLFAASRPLAEKFTKDQPPGVGADRFVGKTGVVLQEIDNIKNTGRVRTRKEEWRADSATGDIIHEGDRIKVTRVEGTHLVVEKLMEEE